MYACQHTAMHRRTCCIQARAPADTRYRPAQNATACSCALNFVRTVMQQCASAAMCSGLNDMPLNIPSGVIPPQQDSRSTTWLQPSWHLPPVQPINASVQTTLAESRDTASWKAGPLTERGGWTTAVFTTYFYRHIACRTTTVNIMQQPAPNSGLKQPVKTTRQKAN